MDKLSERVERAEGASLELDEAIADALFSEKQRHCIKGLSDEEGGAWFWRNPDGSIGTALRFTDSIDAALTLVPTELFVTMGTNAGGWANLWRREPASGHVARGVAATPALALTAAAIRARAILESDHEPE